MSERKIVVPEGMLKAAQDAFALTDEDTGGHEGEVLEAALRWLSENPNTEDVTAEIWLGICRDLSIASHVSRLREFQRRMFVALEPAMIGAETVGEFCSRHKAIGPAVIEAYQRGRNDAAK